MSKAKYNSLPEVDIVSPDVSGIENVFWGIERNFNSWQKREPIKYKHSGTAEEKRLAELHASFTDLVCRSVFNLPSVQASFSRCNLLRQCIIGSGYDETLGSKSPPHNAAYDPEDNAIDINITAPVSYLSSGVFESHKKVFAFAYPAVNLVEGLPVPSLSQHWREQSSVQYVYEIGARTAHEIRHCFQNSIMPIRGLSSIGVMIVEADARAFQFTALAEMIETNPSVRILAKILSGQSPAAGAFFDCYNADPNSLKDGRAANAVFAAFFSDDYAKMRAYYDNLLGNKTKSISDSKKEANKLLRNLRKMPFTSFGQVEEREAYLNPPPLSLKQMSMSL